MTHLPDTSSTTTDLPPVFRESDWDAWRKGHELSAELQQQISQADATATTVVLTRGKNRQILLSDGKGWSTP